MRDDVSGPDGSALSEGLGPALEDAAYDCLSLLASVETYDINLRDHPEAWAAIEALAAKVRAAERERCARLCDEQERQWLEADRLCGGDDGNEICRANMAAELAAEIRA